MQITSFNKKSKKSKRKNVFYEHTKKRFQKRYNKM